MEKRYQVFVSSTYADLKEERRRVIQALMEMDCIPSGMELFPAADEEQWQFIRRVIDDCDYYLLIIGGRYGSTTPEGVSYTEMEYDYAIEKGIRVIALLHANPDDISVGKSEIDSELRARLKLFREKVASNRLVKFCNTTEELPGLVALSLSKTMKLFPAVGWTRADRASNESLLAELNEVRKENERLKTLTAAYEKHDEVEIEHLAGLEEKVMLRGRHYMYNSDMRWSVEVTWQEVFATIAPYLIKYPNDDFVKSILSRDVYKKAQEGGKSPELDDQDFQTIRTQLVALKLVATTYSQTTAGGMALFGSLTTRGEALLMETRTVRSKG